MNRVIIRNFLLFMLLAGLISGRPSPERRQKPGKTERPNILLILSDDHSYPHLGCYGDVNSKKFNITPNFDEFASEGMRFDRAYTTAPQCAPSRTSIFTGQSAVRAGATRFGQPAKPGTQFFTDHLRNNGYWAGMDGRHQHLQGRANEPEYLEEIMIELGMRPLDDRFDYFVPRASTGNVEKIPEWFNSIMDRVPEGKPFFLYFGFNQTHRGFGESHEGIDPDQLELQDDWPDLPEVRLDYARFFNKLRQLDRGFGYIMDVLEERDLEENTMVVFMGDNGEAILRGKGTLHQRGIHVPLVIRWPGVTEAGSASDALISGEDLAPTFLQAAGLEIPEDMTGISFLPVLKGKSFEGRKYVYAERGWHWGPITNTDGWDLCRSITSDRYHLIYNATPNQIYWPVDQVRKNAYAWLAIKEANSQNTLSPLYQRLYFQRPRPVIELYDLKRDPFELHNLAGDPAYKSIEDELRRELDRWMVREGDFLPLPSHSDWQW
jgi:arylsulfatase A-like enzyme